jgi:putative hemolysin
VAETLGVEFPETEEYDTLGGLVYAQLSVIPEDGSHPEVVAEGLRINVEEISDRRVEWALVSKELPEETPES